GGVGNAVHDPLYRCSSRLELRFAGMKRSTARAGALLFARVEGFKQRRQVVDDAFELHFDAMNARIAVQAIPFEAVDQPLRPLPLDHKPDAARDRTLRRMPDMRRQQEDIAFADRYIARLPVVEDAQHDIAGKLVEELLQRIV